MRSPKCPQTTPPMGRARNPTAYVPYDAITPERIKEEMLSNLTVQGEEIETREGSYANTLVSVMAYQLFKLYQSFPGLLAACFPDEASGEYLDRHAAEVGMQRRPGQKATVVITVTGTDGTQVPIGTTFYAPEQGLCYHSTAEGSIQGGTAAIPAQAAEIGSAYNLPAGAICAMYINVAGIVAVSNEEAAQGGADPESDGDLYARYHLRRTLPITSGNKAHYVTWALEVPGVAHASCIPLWAGNGTVKVIIGGPGRTAVDESIRSACAVRMRPSRPRPLPLWRTSEGSSGSTRPPGPFRSGRSRWESRVTRANRWRSAGRRCCGSWWPPDRPRCG